MHVMHAAMDAAANSKVRIHPKFFDALHAKADAAGHAAAVAAKPAPMVVVGGVPGGPQEVFYESEGLCGFAWVVFAGNTAWGKWAKKAGLARAHHPSGLCLWVSGYGQSVDRKAAYAKAYAGVLKDAGIEAHADSRLD
jgi:hypothetical protein